MLVSRVETAASLPTGTVTFLFTDVQASTRLWEQHPAVMRAALIRHDALIEELVGAHAGWLVRPRGEGDSRFAVFEQASAAIASACAIQLALCQEDWLLPEPLRVRMALHTGEADLRAGDYYGSAVNRCARLRALANGGQVLLSETTALLARSELPPQMTVRDMGAHQLKDLAEPERVFQLLHADLPDDFPPLPFATRQRGTLPAQPTPFVFRSQELRTLVDILRDPEVRLLTLVGTGGIGKTRLAVALAEEMAPVFADGAWFVDLSAIRDASLVSPTIAHTFGLQNEGRRSPLERLQDYLRERHILLVLDNCEQVLDAAADIAQLLSVCPDLKILATSREPLRLRWEHIAAISPLALPQVDQTGVQSLAQVPAIAFFVMRAQAADPAFKLTDANQAEVAELCRRLDGLPLALELAAARARSIPPAALLPRLDQQLDLLRGPPDAPARQRSLRATVEWSYDLLPADEQLIFRRLGVCAGGCTLEVAAAVCQADEHSDLLGALAALVDKSLLRQERDADGEMRFRLLQSMSRVALEMLEANQETDAVQQRHADHLSRLAETSFQSAWRPDTAIWLDRVSREHDNFRAALTWLIATGGIEQACLMAAALEQLWTVRGHLSEGQHWLELIVARADEAVSDGARSRALGVLGMLTALLGDPDAAARWGQESLVIARRAGDSEWLCFDLWAGAQIARARGDTATALGAISEAVELSQTNGLKAPHGIILGLLGRVTIDSGQYREGRALLEQALTILEEVDSPRALIDARRMLGAVALETGELTRGRHLIEQAIAGCRVLGERWMLAACLAYLGYAAAQQGDLGAARKALTESAQLGQGLRDTLNATRFLMGFARLAIAEGQPERAVRLAGAATALIGVMPDRVATSVEKWLAPARAELGNKAAEVLASGRRLSLAEATAFALSTDATGSPSGALTAREVEVAGLVGRGLTNRQIAEALVIAPSTAERHLANIMNKLTMTSRTQVGVWASEHGLAGPRRARGANIHEMLDVGRLPQP